MRELRARIERFETARPFVIARGVKAAVEVLLVEIRAGRHLGRGEGTAIYYRGESAQTALLAAESMREAIRDGAGRADLLHLLPAGAARNAIDAALFDLEAKERGVRAAALAGLPPPAALQTAFTISLGTPAEMAAAARAASRYPLLKLKLGGAGDEDRVAAVRAAVPGARLIADANESWQDLDVERLCALLSRHGVELVEQPLPRGADEPLRHMRPAVPLAADESLQDAGDLDEVAGRYRFINVKLDKCGGLTAALQLVAAARRLGLGLMTGCMLSTSLGVAPAFLLATLGRYADLDGPLLLRHDRPHGLRFDSGLVQPPDVALWG